MRSEVRGANTKTMVRSINIVITMQGQFISLNTLVPISLKKNAFIVKQLPPIGPSYGPKQKPIVAMDSIHI